MTSIKVKFRPSAADGLRGSIFYQVIHERQVRQICTDYQIHSDEWDNSRSIVRIGKVVDRSSFILSIRDQIRCDLERMLQIDRKLAAKGLQYTADDVIDEFKHYTHECSLVNFMEGIITKLRDNDNVRTSETYRCTLNRFRQFLRETNSYGANTVDDILIDRIDSELMEAFEAWSRKKGLVPNTVSFYTRILRAVYNRAVDRGLIDNRNPFKHVYTGVDKTIKRALPLQVIRKIKVLDLSRLPVLDFARDMFMLSFYLRGMSFIDMSFLKKSDLDSGYIVYRRRKTGRQLIVKWTREMKDILDKYPENESDYLLPIIRKKDIKERCVYRNMSYNVNHGLKCIAAMVGITAPLTLYVARHSWASAAKAKGIPLSVISEGMGHDSESTTQIYLASLNTSVVDKANSLILRSL